MSQALPKLELMRSETFPFAERYAVGASPLGSLAYFDTHDAGTATADAPFPPVVLLHALGTNFTQWEHVAPILARHTRVIGLDMPGCGHSQRPQKPYRMADLCEAVRGLLRKLEVERPIIIGHSFGGRIAMELCLADPGRYAGLVLINCAGLIHYPRIFNTLGKQLLRPKVVGTLMFGLAPIFLHRIFGKENARGSLFMRQVFGRIEPQAAFNFANHAYPMLPDLVSNICDRMPELKLPVQVIWGERDALLDLKRIEPVLRQIPDVVIDSFADCGHMPNLEKPEELCQVIVRFFDRVRGSASASRAHTKSR